MKGMTVQLAVKTVTGYDPFGAPIETEELIDVEDVAPNTLKAHFHMVVAHSGEEVYTCE